VLDLNREMKDPATLRWVTLLAALALLYSGIHTCAGLRRAPRSGSRDLATPPSFGGVTGFASGSGAHVRCASRARGARSRGRALLRANRGYYRPHSDAADATWRLPGAIFSAELHITPR